ncbi:Cisd-3.2 [Aphelenchoides bicaudatus]|nr:Cisd-3.2 [Aphelenchoides bicaudatus]
MFRRSTRLVNQVQARCLGIKNVDIKNPSAAIYPEKGVEAAKGPVRVTLEAGKTYCYCNCGQSTRQPFCDGTHNILGRTNLRPIYFTVNQTGEYSLCQCKQTDSRPICDGSHKQVSLVPPSEKAVTRLVGGMDVSPVYEGVAKDLGYRSKKGFQKA